MSQSCRCKKVRQCPKFMLYCNRFRLNFGDKVKKPVKLLSNPMNPGINNMKRILALLIGVAGLSIPGAQAQLLFSEGFNYPNGSDLGGQVNPGNSTAWNSGNSGLTITNVQLSYSPELNPN